MGDSLSHLDDLLIIIIIIIFIRELMRMSFFWPWMAPNSKLFSYLTCLLIET